ncbi:hypothetical protein B0T21DRAFT_361787 [Apiosordaria backusii]|uniref:FluG domain-containing protein n=1 Tax=Apiosordaria backusii TaxID=314023 RepID=A0AA40BRF8_9PEZI|nr:hypothetical protein B0T21DRAFT_361787 [Apiosordaria backusii]
MARKRKSRARARLSLKHAEHKPSTNVDYEALQRRLEQWTPKRNYAQTTQVMMSYMVRMWEKFCQHMNLDPKSALTTGKRERFMVFFQWICDNSNVSKKSTLLGYKRAFKMVYEKSVGPMNAEVYQALHTWIEHELRESFELSAERREKPVLCYDDVFRLLQTHWGNPSIKYPSERQRLNVALMQQISFFTATRPRTLCYRPLNPERLANHYVGQESHSPPQGEQKEHFKTLTYRDVSLFTLPNPEGPKDLIAMEITLRYTKGWEKNPNPKKFILYEVDNLMFDATVLMIAIGLLDDAFKNKFSSVQDLYSIRTSSNRGSLDLCWKESILDVPIFRHPGSDCLRTSSCVQPIRYNTYLQYLHMLGEHSGFMEVLTPYAFRRGAGEAIEGVATQGQLQQVMNHRDAGIYQAYINERVQVDVVAAIIGQPSKPALMRAATHLGRSVDPRAPVKPTADDLKIVGREHHLEELEYFREVLRSEIISESGTLKKARDAKTELYAAYEDIVKKTRVTRLVVQKEAEKRTRDHFFNNVSSIEIDRQLHNRKSDYLDQLEAELDTKLQSGDILDERRLVTQLLVEDLSERSESIRLQARLYTVDTLVSLGRLTELSEPTSTPANDHPAQLASPTCEAKQDGLSQDARLPCETTHCFFCYWDQASGRRFSTRYKVRDHLKRYHLKQYDEHSTIQCPSPTCRDESIGGITAFKSHLASEHSYDVFAQRFVECTPGETATGR